MLAAENGRVVVVVQHDAEHYLSLLDLKDRASFSSHGSYSKIFAVPPRISSSSFAFAMRLC